MIAGDGSGGLVVFVGFGVIVGDGINGIFVGAVVISGFTNPAATSAGNSFLAQALTPRIRSNPRDIIIQRFNFLLSLRSQSVLRQEVGR